MLDKKGYLRKIFDKDEFDIVGSELQGIGTKGLSRTRTVTEGVATPTVVLLLADDPGCDLIMDNVSPFAFGIIALERAMP